MTTKKFTKNNQSFICINCNKPVSPHPSSSRDHCNFCLYGLHVDINPGDRQNLCQSILIPRSLDIKNGKTKIIYKCSQCHQIIKNIVAPDDNMDIIISLINKKVDSTS